MKFNKIFIFFLVITIALYFFNITKYPTFWMDEAWDISVAWSYLKKGVFGNPTYPLDGLDKAFFLHPPLPILSEIPLIKLFGITPLTIRFWAIFCGLGSILFLYLLVKRLFKEKVAFWSSVFLAVNPLFFLMSRQLRPEIYVTFFTILSFYFLSLAKEKKNNLFYFLTGITSALSFLSHYYGAFLIGAIFLVLVIDIFRKRAVSLRNLLIFLIGIILILIPFFIWILRNFEIFKIQFFGNLSNLTGIHKLINNFLKEKERYLKFRPAIGMVGFMLLGLILFLRKILTNTPELLLFCFIFLFGIAFFMPNKTVIYLTPVVPIVSIMAGLMISEKPDILEDKKLLLAVKLIAIGFLLASLFYTFQPKNMSAYFKGIPYNVLNKDFNEIIEKHYQNGKIIGDPTYFLFLSDNLKENFNCEHVLFNWLKERDPDEVFKEKEIQIFIYSPYWWNDWCRNENNVCLSLEEFLKNKGELLKDLKRNGEWIDYIYKINY